MPRMSLWCLKYMQWSHLAFGNRTVQERCVKLQDVKQPTLLVISDIVFFQAIQCMTKEKDKNLATLFQLMLLMTEQFLSAYLFQRNINFVPLQPLCYSIFLKNAHFPVSIPNCRSQLKPSKFKMTPFKLIFNYTHWSIYYVNLFCLFVFFYRIPKCEILCQMTMPEWTYSQLF